MNDGIVDKTTYCKYETNRPPALFYEHDLDFSYTMKVNETIIILRSMNLAELEELGSDQLKVQWK